MLMFAVTMTSSLLGVGLLVVMIVSALATRALVWSIIMVGVFFGRGSIITITIRTVCSFGVTLAVTSCWIAAAGSGFHGEIVMHNINTRTL